MLRKPDVNEYPDIRPIRARGYDKMRAKVDIWHLLLQTAAMADAGRERGPTDAAAPRVI
jgi:hypothetical protein